MEGEETSGRNPRPKKFVAAEIPHHTPSRHCRRWRETARVEGYRPFSGVRYPGGRVASRYEVRVVNGKVPVIAGDERIAASAERHRERRPARRGNDGAKLPSSDDIRSNPGLGPRHLPDGCPHQGMAYVEVARTDSVLLAKQKRHGD